ncbi:MAG TPA: glycosyltransferase family 2 protein [Pirellulaceae bacterium]|nr:glycosyltransferase family 2 protein [Pirellulaceae bacterium]
MASTAFASDVIEVSIVVPVYNEQENVAPLVSEIEAAMSAAGRSWELIVVDDGSRDETSRRLKQLATEHRWLKVIVLRRNFGQTAAMHAGIQMATGRVIVTLDGDLQNDPRDIPQMLALLDQGYDLVHGWRRQRQDRWLSRRLPSRLANWLIRKVTGVPIRDLGCTLKAVKRELAQQLELYGEMHRFIAILAHQLGARMVEMETHHRPRRFGTTKYGLGRTTRVLLDLMTVKYMLKYFDSPMKLFGQFGIGVGLLGLVSFAAVGVMKLWGGMNMTGNPLLLLGVLATILSAQFFSLGLLGEVNARIYFAHAERQNYQVRECINFPEAEDAPTVDRRAA